MSLARRLGGRAARRRRHVKVAVAAGVLAVVAGALVLFGGGDDGRRAEVLAACEASNVEIATAYGALVREATDPAAAVEGFLADAFVDLTRARADAVEAVGPDDEVAGLVAQWRTIATSIEGDPAAAVAANPFESVNQRWRDAGLAACAIDPTTVPSDAGL